MRRRLGVTFLFAGAAFLLAAGSVGRPRGCAAVRHSGFPICKETPRGIVLAATQAEADAAAAAAAEGERRFRTHFGRPARYAVVIGDIPAGLRQRLGTAGYPVVLPWLTAAASRQALEDSVRRGIEARLEGKGMSEEQKGEAVAAAIAQVRGRQSSNRPTANVSAVAHELGHMWLLYAYWRGPAAAEDLEPSHYGGPAPDWLDEAAAIAMEDESLTAPRRTHFREMANGGLGGVAPLASFFAMSHPLAGLAALAQSKAEAGERGTSRIMVLTADEVQRRLGVGPEAGPNFYAQSRVVADFLIDSSGNPRILGELARALAGGATIEQWLAARGRRNRLQPSLAGLESQWQAWIDLHYRSPAPAS